MSMYRTVVSEVNKAIAPEPAVAPQTQYQI
jgi:hypothetical protein